VRPVLWSGAKSLGREALHTGGNIMTEIAGNPGETGYILSKHAKETTQNIIKKLRSGGRKRKKASSHNHKAKRVQIAKRKSSKRKAPPKTIKRDIVIRISHYLIMSGEVEFVSSEFDIFAPKPVQSAILETDVVHYKPIATVDQNDLEF